GGARRGGGCEDGAGRGRGGGQERAPVDAGGRIVPGNFLHGVPSFDGWCCNSCTEKHPEGEGLARGTKRVRARGKEPGPFRRPSPGKLCPGLLGCVGRGDWKKCPAGIPSASPSHRSHHRRDIRESTTVGAKGQSDFPGLPGPSNSRL